MTQSDAHNSMDGSAVERYLGDVARLHRVAQVAAATLPLLSGVIILAVGAVLIDAKFPMGPAPRVAVAALLIGATLWSIARLMFALAPAPRRRQRLAMYRAARLAERRLGLTDSSLINAAQLTEADSPTARAALIRLQLRALQRISGVPARSMISWRRPIRAVAGLLAAAALVALLALAFPRLARFAGPRFAAPLADHPPFTWTDFSVSITPQELTIGEDARVVVETRGEIPDALRLAVCGHDGSALGTIEMTAEGPRDQTEFRAFAATLRALREPIRIFAEGSTGRSESVAVVPVPRPRLLAASARAIVDATPGGAPHPLRFDAVAENRLAAAPGAMVEVRLDCSIPLATLEVQGNASVEWRIDGAVAHARIGPLGNEPVALSMRAISAEDLASRDAVALTLTPIDLGVGNLSGSQESTGLLVIQSPTAPTTAAGAEASSAPAGESEKSQADSGDATAASSNSRGSQDRESTQSASSRGHTGSAGGGTEGVAADGSVPRSGDLPADTGDGARRAVQPAQVTTTRPGLGEQVESGSAPNRASLARVPEAYRDMVGRYFSIIAARERERREGDDASRK